MAHPSAPREVVSASRLTLKLLTDGDVARLHSAALELLGREAAAAQRAVALSPRSVVLAGRDPARAIRLDGRQAWLAAGGPAALVRPDDDGRPRAATAADLAAACRLADAHPDVACLVGPPVRAADLGPLGELACCLASCRKHVQIVTLRTAVQAEQAVRMAAAVVSDPGELGARPPISLRVRGDCLEAGIVFARAGLPVGLVMDVGAGALGAGLAGTLARHHAGVLAGCRAIQDAAPGAPFLYSTAAADEVSLAPGPDAVRFSLAAMQLAAHVGLPAWTSALGTDAADPGWQAGADNAFAALGAVTTGSAVVCGAGMLAGGRVFSATQLVMDAELFSWNQRVAAGIPVDDETLALDSIRSVGVGGNHLGQRHTRRHMREIWRPRLLDRSSWDAWVAGGRRQSLELARSLAAELLDAPPTAQLDAAAERALAGIVAESDE
jgi:trimethylamine---corrinoid protein Co-methyltransferase